VRRRRLDALYATAVTGCGSLAGGAGRASFLSVLLLLQIAIVLFRQAALGLIFGNWQQGTDELAGEADGNVVDNALKVMR
jgi:hypothetical protein